LINDSKNSGASLSFKTRAGVIDVAIVAAFAVVTIAIAGAWFFRHDYILHYGDAQSHLNISRGLIDSRTPGYEQLGSVWLPLLHVLCLPFVASDVLWSTGLAGTIPVAFCFVVAVVFFYLAAREAYRGIWPAAVTAACFALNPNLLYLSSIPMTETVFFAGLSVQLFALLRFRRTQSHWLVLVGGSASVCASLTRYDGWFLIPFFALGFFLTATKNRFRTALTFLCIACLAPLYWVAHVMWATGDALSFYRGPSSAKAIYERGLAEGYPRDPVDHNFRLAVLYYWTAGRLCTGWPLVWVGIAGAIAAIWKKNLLPLTVLSLTPCFYIWTMYSTGQPIHVPNLYPFSYYNTRYGIALLPLCAFGAGALAAAIPARWRPWAVLLPLFGVAAWVIKPSAQNWICWHESEFNSHSRRFWTAEVAGFLKAHYREGEGILYAEGDIPGALCRARIHLSQALTQGNGAAYLANAYQPGRVPLSKWVIVMAADRDPLAKAIDTANWRRTVYTPVLEIYTKNDPVIRVYRRAH
jgi:hypothetical protein